MWCKVLLFAFFLCLLFVLSRLREAIAYYEGGYLASRLLDPVSLSARKLKLLLDQRGVSYAGVVEKTELTSLVQTTGESSEGELESAQQEEETSSYTEFKGGSHFYEEVEDSKDSVWVVQVVYSPQLFMAAQEWTSFVQKVSRFGVRTGYFDCSLDQRLCDHKGWFSPRLILALPQGNKAKDNVVLKNYVGSSRTQAVLDWVNYNLASRIKEIHSISELENDWLKFHDKKQKLRLILVSTLKVPPMFYSVMSVKFTGRASFGTINVNSATGQSILNATRWKNVPAYMVLMPEQLYIFGSSPGEYPNFHSIALFLKTLHPEVNDMFLLSLVIVNVISWFELALARGRLFKRLGSLLWHICKWNCLLILLCFPVLGLFQLPFMDLALDGALKLLRLVGTSWLASLVRADWLAYYSNNIPFLAAVFTIYATLVGLLHYKYRSPEDDAAANAAQPSRLRLSWDTYANFLFQPISGAVPFMQSTREMELDAGMEMLIDQLALPNMWLSAFISNDYLQELPTWKYTGPNIDSDIGSDTETTTPRVHSDHEDTADLGDLSPREHEPDMFMCETCRALQQTVDMSEEGKQKREQERQKSESACAKYLMDGNYKCMCRHSGHSEHDSHQTHPRHSPKTSPVKLKRTNSKSELEANVEKVAKSHDTEIYQPPPGMLPVLDCSICLEGLKYGVVLCGLPCKHCFHHDCIMHWLKQYNHLCPLCRWPAYKAKPCSFHQHSE